MRLLIIVSATLVLLAGLVLLARDATTAPTPLRTPSDSHARPTTVAQQSSSSLPVAVPVVQSLADVQRNERALVAMARETHTLRRDDMAVLHQEIDSLHLDEATRLRSHRELSQRLRSLSRELELAPTQNELARLLGEIHMRRGGAERDRLVASYGLAAHSLPPMHRSDALAKLDAELR
jgi:hypothetical protein